MLFGYLTCLPAVKLRLLYVIFKQLGSKSKKVVGWSLIWVIIFPSGTIFV